MVFEAPGPTNVHVWSPRAHTCTFEGSGFQITPPKFNEKTARGESENLGGPAEGGPAGGVGSARSAPVCVEIDVTLRRCSASD